MASSEGTLEKLSSGLRGVTLSDTLSKKQPRKYGDRWTDHDFTLDVETKELAYTYRGQLKGKGTVVGLTDVVDRERKRQHRFNIQCQRHAGHPGSESICVSAHDFATKAKWLASDKATVLDEDGDVLPT